MLYGHRGVAVLRSGRPPQAPTVQPTTFETKCWQKPLSQQTCDTCSRPRHLCKLFGLHWYVAFTLESAKGEHIRCAEGVCRRPFHVLHVLLIVCCDCFLAAATLILTKTAPQNLECPAMEGKSLAFVASECLGHNGTWVLTRHPSTIAAFLFSFTKAQLQNQRINFSKNTYGHSTFASESQVNCNHTAAVPNQWTHTHTGSHTPLNKVHGQVLPKSIALSIDLQPPYPEGAKYQLGACTTQVRLADALRMGSRWEPSGTIAVVITLISFNHCSLNHMERWDRCSTTRRTYEQGWTKRQQDGHTWAQSV